jgi:hypothetical protein
MDIPRLDIEFVVILLAGFHLQINSVARYGLSSNATGQISLQYKSHGWISPENKSHGWRWNFQYCYWLDITVNFDWT